MFQPFQVSTIVQVVGIILCLHAATKISHRAQGIAALASRWHALMTCGSSSSEGSAPRTSSNVGNSEPPYTLSSLHTDYSESDLESFEYVAIPTSAQLASYMSTYHKRQAFGTELNFLRFYNVLSGYSSHWTFFLLKYLNAYCKTTLSKNLQIARKLEFIHSPWVGRFTPVAFLFAFSSFWNSISFFLANHGTSERFLNVYRVEID